MLHLHESLHTLIRYHLKFKVKVPFRWETFLNYNVYQLARRLKQTWQPGMSWQNMGRIKYKGTNKKLWQIDHIKCRSEFSFSHYTDPAFQELYKLDNIQALWEKENKQKASLSPEEWEIKKKKLNIK